MCCVTLDLDEMLEREVDVVGLRSWWGGRMVSLGETSSSASEVHDDSGFELGGLGWS